MNDLYIMGAGGLGKEMAWHLEMLSAESKGLHLRGFVDDDESKWHSRLNGYPVLGRLEEVIESDAFVLLGVGDPKQRLSAMNRIRATGAAPYTLIGPETVRATSARLGKGTVTEIGVIIGPDVIIGDGALINKRAIVAHDVKVGSYCNVSPFVLLSGGGGGCQLGPGCNVGAHSAVLPGVSVGKGCVIGAGAVVAQSLPPFSLAVGVPAVIKKQLPEWEI